MVDIHAKRPILRIAKAEGAIYLKPETIELIRRRKIEKGDVISVSTVSAIMAAKNTPQILPLCHPIPIENVNVEFELHKDKVKVIVTVKSTSKTGVEMEALTAVSAALLCIWDMVKKYEKDKLGQYPYTRIEYIRVLEKIKKGSTDES